MGADTLLGVTDQPGWHTGYGPIPPAMARTIATDSTWRPILTDPTTGSALDYAATTHDPGAVLTGHSPPATVTASPPTAPPPPDGTHTDLDHTTPYPRGATEAGFGLQQPTPGVFTWTTPTGRKHHRRPPALTEPRTHWRQHQRPPR